LPQILPKDFSKTTKSLRLQYGASRAPDLGKVGGCQLSYFRNRLDGKGTFFFRPINFSAMFFRLFLIFGEKPSRVLQR